MAITDLFFGTASAQGGAPSVPGQTPPPLNYPNEGREEFYGGSGQQSGASPYDGPMEDGEIRGYGETFGDDTRVNTGKIEDPVNIALLDNYSLPDAIAMGATLLTEIAMGLAVGFLIWGALNFAMAAGDEEKTEHAKEIMRWSIIGLIISLMAFSAVYTVTNLIGYSAPS